MEHLRQIAQTMGRLFVFFFGILTEKTKGNF